MKSLNLIDDGVMQAASLGLGGLTGVAVGRALNPNSVDSGVNDPLFAGMGLAIGSPFIKELLSMAAERSLARKGWIKPGA